MSDLPLIDDVEDRAALRAFLQRCEVRLSTIHRVATALLSGAGIMVLLPAVERDAVVTVLRSLLHGELSVSRGLLATAVVSSLALVVGLLWMVIRELTTFYFHSNHIRHGDVETFAPRFTLTSLRLPRDELHTDAEAEYDEIHLQRHNLDLIVPANPTARSRIDRQLAAYPALADSDGHRTDAERANALLELAGARRRDLLDEVTKIEYGMARHMLRIEVVVLRYVKALLVVVLTVLATLASAAAVTDATAVTAADQRWIAAVMALWAPCTIFVTTAPVRWIEDLLRAEGATRSTAGLDPEFSRAEDVASIVAIGTWALSVVALALLTFGDHPMTTRGNVGAVSTLVVSAGLIILGVGRWKGGPTHRGRAQA